MRSVETGERGTSGERGENGASAKQSTKQSAKPRLKPWAALCIVCCAAPAIAADDEAFRFNASIRIEQPAAFVQMQLPVSAYARTAQPNLNDLRVVDARGERVPFALLAPRAAEATTIEQQRDASLYPLPAKPKSGGDWPSPVEVTVQGDRISVKRLGKTVAAPDPRSPGWLIDLGERPRDDPPPLSLRLLWSGPAEFSAGFSFQTSDELRNWRHGGHGQVMALASATGPLTQPTVMLPANAGRFVRLVWADTAAAPAISGVRVIAARHSSVALDAPTELVFNASAEPAGKNPADADAARAVHFDLGAVLPLVQLDLKLPPLTRVAPVRVQGRRSLDEPWRELASSVFYRLDRSGDISISPPLTLHTGQRYLRVLPDARAAALDAQQTQLVVQAQLAGIVFAAQGQAPYLLLAGAGKAAAGALPLTTLVPALEDERKRFGRATLGEWSEVAAVARQMQSQLKLAALRPWLLWAVLLAGVAGLAFMVWRLARGGAPSA